MDGDGKEDEYRAARCDSISVWDRARTELLILLGCQLNNENRKQNFRRHVTPNWLMWKLVVDHAIRPNSIIWRHSCLVSCVCGAFWLHLNVGNCRWWQQRADKRVLCRCQNDGNRCNCRTGENTKTRRCVGDGEKIFLNVRPPRKWKSQMKTINDQTGDNNNKLCATYHSRCAEREPRLVECYALARVCDETCILKINSKCIRHEIIWRLKWC